MDWNHRAWWCCRWTVVQCIPTKSGTPRKYHCHSTCRAELILSFPESLVYGSPCIQDMVDVQWVQCAECPHTPCLGPLLNPINELCSQPSLKALFLPHHLKPTSCSTEEERWSLGCLCPDNLLRRRSQQPWGAWSQEQGPGRLSRGRSNVCDWK